MAIPLVKRHKSRAVNPGSARRFQVRAQIPVLAYEEHPAFQGLQADEPPALRAAVEELAPLEPALRYLASGSLLDLVLRQSVCVRRTKARAALLQDIEPRFARFEARLLAARSDWSAFEVETIRKLVLHMFREVQNEVNVYWRRFFYSSVEQFTVDPQTPGLAEMRRDGCKTYQLAFQDIARLRHLLAADEADLRAMDTKGRPISAITLLDLGNPAKAEFTARLSECLERYGVFRLASQYLRAPTKLQYVSLYLNRPQDWWWRKRYTDLGMTLPRTANMHYDSYSGMVKCMLYLTEVEAGSGPFCYIPGSHRARIGLVQRTSGKGIPYADLNLESVEQRRFFMRLPAALRNISHFGDDLIPGSNLEQAYLRAERQFVAPCNLVLFDNYGLHRGGLSETSERVALQINIIPEA